MFESIGQEMSATADRWWAKAKVGFGDLSEHTSKGIQHMLDTRPDGMDEGTAHKMLAAHFAMMITDLIGMLGDPDAEVGATAIDVVTGEEVSLPDGATPEKLKASLTHTLADMLTVALFRDTDPGKSEVDDLNAMFAAETFDAQPDSEPQPEPELADVIELLEPGTPVRTPGGLGKLKRIDRDGTRAVVIIPGEPEVQYYSVGDVAAA